MYRLWVQFYFQLSDHFLLIDQETVEQNSNRKNNNNNKDYLSEIEYEQ